jgi:PleD family two-component response regulator
MSFPEYPEVKIAVSLGVVTHRLGPETQENVTVDTLIAEAELQLAKATQSGQNRVFGSIVL